MYRESLTLQSGKSGTGVFTKTQIPANVPILEIRGSIYTEDKLPDPTHPALLQIGTNTFMAATGTIDGPDYLNHSCNPNCLVHIVGNRAILYSMYVIPSGSELTIDYSANSTDTLDKWTMNCACKENNCRGTISGFQYLEPSLQENMKAKGMVPMYILHSNMFPKR